MEQKKTEGLIPVSDQFSFEAFTQIVINASVAISITDNMGNILFVNKCFIETTGYSEQELYGKNSSILSYKMTPQSVYQHLWKAISNNQVWNGQLINRRKDGSLYIADISISALSVNEGPSYYYSIQRDITDTHKLETEQRNQSTLFHAILDSAPISMALVDDQNQIIFKNKKYDLLASRSIQKPIELLLEHLENDYNHHSIEQYLGQEAQRSKSIYTNTDGLEEEKWLDFTLVKIPVQDTKTEAYFHPTSDCYTLVGIIDRTKEKQYLEEKRLNTITLLVNDNKFVHSMQEVMMATLHQLQGPLNMVDSAVTILKQTNHSCPGLTAMDNAMESATNALSEIKLAIPERIPEVIQHVNLNQSVRDAVSISTKELLSSSTNIDFNLDSALSAIKGKPNRLLLAIKQIIDNAIDAIQIANGPVRSVVVSTYENIDETILSIEDSGGGINDDIRHKIFQPFYSTKPKTHSSCRGIGFALVHQVMNEHSAMIEIGKSQSLGGACIQLIFPKSSH
ncbi:nitrogen fixation negative regulator NifL [Vibrio sp. 10N.286.49.B3]|uniref:nitrogen fixation negative regulator NifL n=1 Tax=Vibrio sp. 10N.286.49.B3 TaxID=1880855 RepID=UPI000C81A639|nr:nitrogen fixation negative regulator NifL [Vibrio sp. 10N.286.49.B3]PMH44868.1 nitrogen fixation negative regulator NifL [Vibrio sp. 10N.286.49.B3]